MAFVNLIETVKISRNVSIYKTVFGVLQRIVSPTLHEMFFGPRMEVYFMPV